MQNLTESPMFQHLTQRGYRYLHTSADGTKLYFRNPTTDERKTLVRHEDGWSMHASTVAVRYYAADGYSEPEDWRLRERAPHGETFASMDAARAAIHQAYGDHGSWRDEDGNECWHESDAEGCGGFCIAPVQE